ncbi:MAG: DUF805 domain-containing protein [Chromatiaceae bacterium]|jgi:uncharacterized membrane protein YhaH (DUF805 family)
MGFVTAIKTCFSKYVTFSGRARRPEYWWFFLFIILGSVIASFIDGAIFGVGTPQEPPTQLLSPIFSLATFLPMLAAGWRRMHDTGKPGWYLLIPLLVTVAGMVALMVGALSLGHLDMAGVTEETLGTDGAGPGMAALAVFGIVQLAVSILIVWWLTRPTQPGPNAYGEEPPVAP